MRRRTAITDDGGRPEAAEGNEQEITHLRAAPASAHARRVAGPPRPRPRPGRPVPAGQTLTLRSQPRFAPKAAATRRARAANELRHCRVRPAIVLAGLVVVLLAASLGAYGVVSAGFFRVRNVEVVGAANVSIDDIVHAADAEGRELFLVNLLAARRGVERVPGIKRAQVQRRWPRRVVVTVEERTPVAVWSTAGTAYAVDSEGIVLDFVPDPAMVTIHQTDGAGGLLAEDRVDGDAVNLALRLYDSLPASVGQRAARFEWSRRAGLEVTTDRGMRVRFGDGGDIDYKLAVWRGILDQARRDKAVVTEIDLRFGDRVYYR
jgi:cell division protein FtsQ